MNNIYTYASGDEIEIRMDSPDLSVERWEPGKFISYIPATKAICKFNVQLDNGIKLNGVDPSCVRKKK